MLGTYSLVLAKNGKDGLLLCYLLLATITKHPKLFLLNRHHTACALHLFFSLKPIGGCIEISLST